MDKIILNIFIILFFISCTDDNYRIDDSFLNDKNIICTSSIAGVFNDKDFIYIFHQKDEFQTHEEDYYGMLIVNKSTSQYIKPFKKEIYFQNVKMIRDGVFAACYTRTKDSLFLGIINGKNQCIEKEIDLRRLFNIPQHIKTNTQIATENGQICIAVSDSIVYAISKFDYNLLIDTSFKTDPSVFSRYSSFYDIALQKDGNVYICGTFTTKVGYENICKINKNGKIDKDFYWDNSKYLSNLSIFSIRYFDSTMYVSGTYLLKNGEKGTHVLRINTDGTLVSGYNPNAAIFDFEDEEPYFSKSLITSIIEVEDSLLLISGFFNKINEVRNLNPIAFINKKGEYLKNKMSLSNIENTHLKTDYAFVTNMSKENDSIYLIGMPRPWCGDIQFKTVLRITK